MDKNQGIGVVLLLAVLVIYYFVTAPSQAEIDRQQAIQDSISRVKLDQSIQDTPETLAVKDTPRSLADSVRNAQLQSSYGPFAAAMEGVAKEAVLENKLMQITFDSKGGRIKEAILKEHFKMIEDSLHNKSREPLSLLEDPKNKFEYIIPTRQYGTINTSDLIFNPTVKGNTVVMEATLGDGKSIQQVYTLHEDSYKLDYKVRLNGIAQLVDPASPALKFRWHNYLDRIELNTNFERYYSTVYFKEVNEGSDYCNCRKDDVEEVSKRIEWIANVNQFFNSSLVAEGTRMENAVFETVMMDENSPDLKLLKSEADIPLDLSNTEELAFQMYVGPNKFKALKSFDNELEQIIPFGRSIFGTINRYLIRPFFDWLSSFIGSKGVVIILLIFIIKMALYPLMYKMLHSQAKMAALKPELAHLKVKYKDKPQEQQMETMKIYREYGVSPLGGCMPMILQMPIWYALFRFFPASITFRQEPFLWAEDLSSYDVLFYLPFSIPAFGAHVSLFTLLWAVTTIIYSYYNMKHMDMSANPAMKYIQYFMPITFLFFFNTYASGLTCYMFFSNVFNIGQTLITKRFVFDDEKIKEELKAQKSKPKKKGRFQEKLEEAMKQQQQIKNQRTTQGRKKKKK